MLYVKELEENVNIAKSDYIIIIYFKTELNSICSSDHEK